MVGLQRRRTPRHSSSRAGRCRYCAVAHAREAAFPRQGCAVSRSVKRRAASAANRYRRSIIAALRLSGCRYVDCPAVYAVRHSAKRLPADTANRHRRAIIAATCLGGCRYAEGTADYAVRHSAERLPAATANRHRRGIIAAIWLGGCQCAEGAAGYDVPATAHTRPTRFIAGRAGRREAGDRDAAGNHARPFGCSPGDCQIEHAAAPDTAIASRSLETRSRQCETVDRDSIA